jgi:hypothetical protein
MDDISQLKKFYKLYCDSLIVSGTISLYYSIDSGTNWRSLTNTTDIKDISGIWEKKGSIKLKITGTTGVNSVSALSVVYRELVGVR